MIGLLDQPQGVSDLYYALTLLIGFGLGALLIWLFLWLMAGHD